MSTVLINNTDYEVLPLKPKQLATLANIVGKITRDAQKELKASGGGSGMDFIFALLAVLNEDELVKLAALLIGSDEAFAKEYFALDWVTEALAVQLEQSNISAVIKNFTRLSSQALA